MDGTLNDEARSLLAAARAWLRELVEEGVERGEPAAPGAPQPAVEREPAAAGGPERRAPVAAEGPERRAPVAAEGPERRAPVAAERSAPRQPALLDAGPWGEGTTLAAVREALGECTRCRLCEGRRQIVFGDGDPRAELMFVGEGPGETEDRLGLPFVGRAGELLTQMIEKGLGLRRSDVYICNVVKCRPPGNRTPLADEVATCSPFLDGQIAAVGPRVIVALGKPAASLLLGREVAITRLRGTWHEYRGIPLMPTYHPAFVLRQYTRENRRLVWEDLKAALARARSAAGD